MGIIVSKNRLEVFLACFFMRIFDEGNMSNKKFKNYKNIEKLKIGLKKALPQKIASVIQSYEEFADKSVPEDAKSFNAFHGACKSAVNHAETLFKLSKWIDEEAEDNKSSDDEIINIIKQTKNEIAKLSENDE